MLELKKDELIVTLPEGKTAEELIKTLAKELKKIKPKLHGVSLKVNGRITTPMSAYLGHRLSHICKSISFYAPMEKKFVKAVWH